MAQRSNLRASDQDRDQIAERLRRAAAEGRIHAHELEERLARALRARTYGELDAVVADLPRDPVAKRGRSDLTRRVHPAVAIAIAIPVAALAIAVVAVAVAFVVTGFFAFWMIWMVIGWFMFGGRHRRHHHRHQHWTDGRRHYYRYDYRRPPRAFPGR